jgi:MFS family permease
VAPNFEKRSIPVVLVSVGLLVVASNLQTSLLSLRAGLEGFREESIGLLMSSFFLGFTGGSVLTVGFLRSVGYIRTFAALASVASAAALLHGLVISAAAWALLRFIYGLCYAGLVLIVESWLNEETAPELRGRVLGVYGLVFMLGAALGQLTLFAASIEGLALFAVVSVVLSIALVPTTLVRIEEPPIPAYGRFRIGEVFRFSPFGAVAVITAGLVGGVFWSLTPRVIQLLGFETGRVAMTMTAGVAGALVLQWPLGRLSDGVDRRLVILTAAAVGAGVAASLAAVSAGGSPPLGALLLLVALFGGSVLPLYSLALAHINDHLPREDLVPAAATVVLLFGLASATGPVAASMLLRAMGPAGVFLYAAVVLCLFILFALARLPLRPALRRPAKRLFQALPRTTHLAARFIHHRGREPYRHGDFDDGTGQKDTA